LGPDTNLAELEQLAILSEEEKIQRSELAIQIANFELDKTKIHIERLNQQIRALEIFSMQWEQAQTELSAAHVREAKQAVQNHIVFRDTAASVGADQFVNIHLRGIGTPVWKQFVEAASKLAEVEAGIGKPYPQVGDFCLFCHQPLSETAVHLIFNMWEYLRDQAQQVFATSTLLLDTKLKSMEQIAIFKPGYDATLPYQVIGEHDQELLVRIKSIMDRYRLRFDRLKSDLTSITSTSTDETLEDCSQNLEHLLAKIRITLAQLEANNQENEIRQLETQKRELDHRSMLVLLYPTIKNHVENQRWARDAQKVGGSTRHITLKHNELFKELVTDEYLKIFAQTLISMGRPLKVKIDTLGKKGQTLKQIVLEAAEDAKDIARPEKVLSEGEKRAVALADYLTEVELDTTSNGIILDDPVTSLDLEWRETIANMLVQKADKRQVVIFTHDLPFLYFLKKKAEDFNKPISSHWIKRGNTDGKPGYVYLDNSPALERDYRKPTKAKELYERAKDAPAGEQESILHDGFGALRTCYEAFIIFDMFEEVVMRFSERISFGRLKEIRWDGNLTTEVIESCERLSTLIEGHLHSDTFGAIKPKPETLLNEIQHFEALRLRLKQLKSKGA